MATYAFEPSADISNPGWAAIGASTSMWATLAGAFVSTNYLSSPSHKGAAIVSFPVNMTALPAGAVISSVSLVVETGTGTGIANPGQPASLTCGIVAANQPSVYTSSTIYPTSSPTVGTVATYKTDPLGNPWDIQSLNNTWFQFWSYCGVSDLVRLYSMQLQINYKSAPTVVVNLPTGTMNTASPIVNWTYTQSDGDFQVAAEYKIFTADQQAAVGFNPQTSTPVFDGTVSGVTTSVQMTHPLPSNSYFVYVRAISYTGANSNWGFQQFALAAPTPGVPGVTDPTGATPAGQGIVGIVADVSAGCADITVQNTSNLLGVHMANVNVDDSGEEWATVNCSVTESVNYSFPGDNTSQSWKFSATAGGNMSATTGFVPVQALSAYTACAQALANTTARSVNLSISFFDASYNFLGFSISSNVSDATGVWNQISYADLTTVGFASAAKAQLTITVIGCGAGEQHYFTHVGIMPGNLSQYTSGGTASTNLLSAWYANAAGSPPSGQSWVGSNGTTIGTYSSTPLGTAGWTGSQCNSMTCATGAGSVALRAVGTTYSSSVSGGAFTLNTPAGVATGDLMLGFCTYTSSGGAYNGTITPPTGWTLVDTSGSTPLGANIWLAVVARTAGASEPGSYTAVLNSSAVSPIRTAVVIAYSGAANVSSQFIAEAQRAGSTSGTAFTSGTVSNTDPGAWRVSAFATGTTGAGATFTANTQPPGIPPIQYVSTAAAYVSKDKLSSYTVNRPPGVQTGDLMIATITADAVAGTVSVPSGWTLARAIAGSGTTGAVLVMKRTAGASEPASWTGTFSVSPTTYGWQKMSSCTAYRNVANATFQFVADNIRQQTSTSSTWTPNVTNTNANAWNVVGFFGFGEAPPSTQTISLTGVGASMSVRYAGAVQNGNYGAAGSGSIGMTYADSAGPQPTGVQAVHGGASGGFWSMAAWEAFLAPLGSAPTPPANETSRVALAVGSSDSLGVFDSNGTVAAQPWSVSATCSQTMASEVSWIGLIRPASATVSGYVSATLAQNVDISAASSDLLTVAGEQLTLGASFIGSTAGTILATAQFYRANVLISAVTQTAGQFNSTAAAWSDCFSVFNIPAGTTQMNMIISSTGRNIGDVVYWNRSMMALGNQGAYIPATSASAHPVWSYPQIQYAEDPGNGSGFGPWATVPGTKSNVPAFTSTGLMVLQDHSIVPLRNRKYRVRTVSYGLNGDQFASPWSPDSDVVNFQGVNWWLKDLLNPQNNLALKVRYENMDITKNTTAVKFQGLGASLPNVLTEGFKGDNLSVKMVPVNQADHVTLVQLLESGNTLYLQSDIDEAWWVQPLSDIQATVLATNQRQSNPLREVTVTFAQVAPVA